MSDDRGTLKEPSGSQTGPLIIPCEEQGPIDIPITDVMDHTGRLRLNPDIEKGDYFRVSLKKGVISLRARGYIGYIPLTDNIVIHVESRNRISNLSRVVQLSGEPPTVLSSIRGYATHSEWNESLLDVYAVALAQHTEQIVSRGPLREYFRRDDKSSSPRGRISVDETLRLRSKGIRYKVNSTWFDRDLDNAPNRCLKYAIWLLTQRYIALAPKAHESRIAYRKLVALYAVFDGVTLDYGRTFINDPYVTGARALPTPRSYYRDALNVAMAVIQQRTVLLDSTSGPVRMPSIVLNMDDIFEAYIRNTLRQYIVGKPLSLSVLDGNNEGKRGLYNHANEPPATPDVVVMHNEDGSTPLVVEVKNVPAHKREYVNQVLTYALVYRTKRVMLVYPRSSAFQPGGLHHLGNVDSVEVYRYRFDLGAEDPIVEDEQFGQTITRLIGLETAS